MQPKLSIPEILEKMIAFSNGNRHDINHLMKVHSFAQTIGRLSGLPDETQYVLEAAAIVHDIAIPRCREMFGNSNPRFQESEGAVMVREFFSDSGLSDEEIDRISYLVGHHHTLTEIRGMDYQILIEADYLVNADEHAYSACNIRNFEEQYFKTDAGKQLLESIFLSSEENTLCAEKERSC